MNCRLSKTKIESYQGDVLPLRLLGEEELTAAEIEWSVAGDCVIARSFWGDAPHSFNDGVMLTLAEVGEATVSATYGGETYTCTVTVRPMEKASSEDELCYYRGDFHCHTSQEHKAPAFAEDPSGISNYIQQMKAEKRLDFGVISDHAEVTNPRDFFRGFTETEAAQPMEFIMFPGSESEISPIEPDRYGLNRKNGGEMVCVNVDNFVCTHGWAGFFDAYSTAPFGVCVFAHPQVVGYDRNGVWNFCFHRINTPAMKNLVRGVEMGDGSDRASNCLNELVYSLALDCGFRVSATCASDCHGPVWGFEQASGKTIVMARKKSKEAFLDALRSNRFYACESGTVKLRYSVNGQTAPADLAAAEAYQFRVEWSLMEQEPTARPVRLQVISDGGKTIYETKDFGNILEFSVPSATARYFFLRLTDEAGRKTWSCPVWTGRAFGDWTPLALPPLDKAGFTVTDQRTGQDVSILVNDDPTAYWEGQDTTAALLIDMGREQQVRALGHYPPRWDRKVLKVKGIRENEAVASFACRYRISTSVDGLNFTEQAEGVLRVFGAEEIISLPPHSARYLKLEVLSTTGAESAYPALAEARVQIGELTVF